MRSAFLVLVHCVYLAACFESEEPQKVELVDSTTKQPPNSETSAISDDDFAALQEEVSELKKELAALKAEKADVSDVTAINSTIANHGARLTTTEANITNHDSELAALGNSVIGLSDGASTKLWLYDGNKVKRHKVVSIQEEFPDSPGNQVHHAIVEVAPEVRARFQIGVFPVVRPSEVAGALSVGSIAFSGTGCTGEPTIFDVESGGDFGIAGKVFGYMAWVTAGTKTYLGGGNTVQSYYTASTGACTNDSLVATYTNRVAILHPADEYRYPNPLTVGP